MDSTSADKDYLQIAVDIAVRLAMIFLFVFSCIRIFTPFLVPVVWGAIISVALYPVFSKLESMFGGRSSLAGAAFIIIALAAVLIPTWLLGDSLLDGTVRIVKGAEEGTLQVPPPTEQVKGWPLIGEKAYMWWDAASKDLGGTLEKLQPQIGKLGEKVVKGVAGLGGAIVQSIFAIIIAGILMMKAGGVGGAMKILGRRLAGEDGEEMVDTAASTIRSVVKGVILVALTQGLMAALGLWFAGVPAIGLWALLVVVVAVIQLPPILILGPIAAWVFANNDSTTVSVIFLIWSLIVSGSDGFLKPMLLGRGVAVPMLVILIGAIGGMLRGGVIGLFIGPVILAIGYQLITAWVDEAKQDEAAADAG